MVISIIQSDEVLNPAWEKHKSGFAQRVAGDFFVEQQKWATGTEEAAAEVKKGCEAVCGQPQIHVTVLQHFLLKQAFTFFNAQKKATAWI